MLITVPVPLSSLSFSIVKLEILTLLFIVPYKSKYLISPINLDLLKFISCNVILLAIADESKLKN